MEFLNYLLKESDQNSKTRIPMEFLNCLLEKSDQNSDRGNQIALEFFRYSQRITYATVCSSDIISTRKVNAIYFILLHFLFLQLEFCSPLLIFQFFKEIWLVFTLKNFCPNVRKIVLLSEGEKLWICKLFVLSRTIYWNSERPEKKNNLLLEVS